MRAPVRAEPVQRPVVCVSADLTLLIPISSRKLSSDLLMVRRRLISRAPTAWALRQSIAWRQAALFPARQGREAAKEMSKRKRSPAQLIELTEQPEPPSISNEALIRAVITGHPDGDP